MVMWVRAAIVCASLCATAGMAQAAGGAKPAGSPIDGTWQASGTVTLARHVDQTTGDHFSRTWTIGTACTKAKKRKCTTTLSYRTKHGKQIRVPLHGRNAGWSGVLMNQTFECTPSGTATGTLSFKLHVTSFTKHKHRRVAQAISATAMQSGTGCANVVEKVSFKVTRQSF